MTTTELIQKRVMTLTVSEAETLLRRVRNSRTFMNYGIEAYTVSTEQMMMNDGSKHNAVIVMVRAETEMQAGIGKGFLLAISEGATG